jgi:hypothetical protein
VRQERRAALRDVCVCGARAWRRGNVGVAGVFYTHTPLLQTTTTTSYYLSHVLRNCICAMSRLPSSISKGGNAGSSVCVSLCASKLIKLSRNASSAAPLAVGVRGTRAGVVVVVAATATAGKGGGGDAGSKGWWRRLVVAAVAAAAATGGGC